MKSVPPFFPTFRPGFIIVFFALTVWACNKESIDTEDCTGLTPTYTGDIKAILDANCALSGCHDAATSQNGVNLSAYATAFSVSREDRFLGVIQHKNGYTPMPYNSAQLPEATVELLTCWVQNGSPQ